MTNIKNLDNTSNESFRQGYYSPEHPEKYLGDVNNIFFRSSWELHAFKFLDRNKNVLRWCSEGIAIPYLKPVHPSVDPRGFKEASYFPDLYVEYRRRDGKIIKEMIEIKPLKQTRASRAKKESVKLQENYTYIVNQAKWQAAKVWCQNYGINFTLLTEDALFKLK